MMNKKWTRNKGEDGKTEAILGSSLHVLSLLNHFPEKIWSVYLQGLGSDGGRRRKRVIKQKTQTYMHFLVCLEYVWDIHAINK